MTYKPKTPFELHYDATSMERNMYIYNLNNEDYIAFLLYYCPVNKKETHKPFSRIPYEVRLSTRAHFLLYFLHKLNVRPPSYE